MSERLKWTIYFENGRHPFETHPEGSWSIEADSAQESEFTSGPAITPGDYKYGVRVENASTGAQLSDDDPRLIVLP